MKLLWDLYFTFAKIGACTFGGGYAMLPILQREIVEKKHWATDADLTDIMLLIFIFHVGNLLFEVIEV